METTRSETRSGALYSLSQRLHELRPELGYQGNQCRSIADLKKEFPGLRDRQLGKVEQIEQLTADLEYRGVEALNEWLNPPQKPDKPDKRKLRRKALISDIEIRQLRDKGERVADIAELAGISKQRVRQICEF